MKTYTFAPKNAPTSEHMAGLVKALRVWRGDLKRQFDNSKSRTDKIRLKGYVDAYDQIISTIVDSNSYGE